MRRDVGRKLVLASETWGDEDGAPIVLLHGALGTKADWRFLPATDGIRWVALDLPSHGESPALSDGTLDDAPWDAWPEVLRTTLATIGVERPALAGYSMGGRLALCAAAASPSAYSKLVIVAGTRGMKSGAAKTARKSDDEKWATHVANATTTEGKRALLTTWWQRPVFGALSSHKNFASLIADRLRRDLARCAPSLVALGTGTMPFVDVKRLGPMPFVAVAGAEDQKFVNETRAMAADAVSGESHLIEGCAHALLVEAQEELTTLLTDRHALSAGEVAA